MGKKLQNMKEGEEKKGKDKRERKGENQEKRGKGEGRKVKRDYQVSR